MLGQLVNGFTPTLDLDGFRWIWMDLDGFGWIWMDLDGFGSLDSLILVLSILSVVVEDFTNVDKAYLQELSGIDSSKGSPRDGILEA